MMIHAQYQERERERATHSYWLLCILREAILAIVSLEGQEIKDLHCENNYHTNEWTVGVDTTYTTCHLYSSLSKTSVQK